MRGVGEELTLLLPSPLHWRHHPVGQQNADAKKHQCRQCGDEQVETKQPSQHGGLHGDVHKGHGLVRAVVLPQITHVIGGKDALRFLPGEACAEDAGQGLYYRKFSSGYTAAGIPGKARYSVKWGYVDRDGRQLTEQVYDEAGDFIDGLAVVGVCDDDSRRTGYGSMGMKYGYLDTDGRLRIPAIYEYASNFYKEEALVSYKGEFFYIDTEGRRTRRFDGLDAVPKHSGKRVSSAVK